MVRFLSKILVIISYQTWFQVLNSVIYLFFRGKERLLINTILRTGLQSRSVVIQMKFNAYLCGTKITIEFSYFLRAPLIDIMDSTRCVKEQGNLVKEFLSSGIII